MNAHAGWPVLLAGALLTGALTGCGSFGGAGSSVPAADPCVGVPSCTQVAVADVDGDGSPDRIGIARVQDAPIASNVAFGTTHVTTRVAIGSTVHTFPQDVEGAAYEKPTDIYRGAFAMTRAQGADIVLHLVPGQGNAERFAVISWDGARLVAVPSPPWGPNSGPSTATGFWLIGSSHGSRDWIRCTQPGEIVRVHLTAALAEGSPVPGGGKREEDKFAFAGSAWQPAGSQNFADTSYSYTDGWTAHKDTFRECKDLSTH